MPGRYSPTLGQGRMDTPKACDIVTTLSIIILSASPNHYLRAISKENPTQASQRNQSHSRSSCV